jgi:hypothetical protein
VLLSKSDTVSILDAIESIKPGQGETVILFIAENSCPDLDDLVARLNDRGVSFVGGVFPGIIQGENHLREGALLKVAATLGAPHYLPPSWEKDLDPPVEVLELVSARPAGLSLMVLSNGLSSHTAHLLGGLFHLVGLDVNFIGGGAGFGDFVSRPCLFSPAGVFEDGLLLLPCRSAGPVGVGHGWEPIHGPLLATRTSGNTVHEFNWQPAAAVYGPLVAQYTGKTPKSENCFDLAKFYPLGMECQGLPHVVRDPIGCGQDGEMICAGEVEEGTGMYIMASNPELMAGAAAGALQQCLSGLAPGAAPASGQEVDLALCAFCCISRLLVLGDQFERELKAMNREAGAGPGALTLEGPLTIGEIASNGQGPIQVFNKTVVSGVIHGR